MTISFRTRLFLVAALIVSAILAVVVALGWSRVLKYEFDQLDQRLCMEARRVAPSGLSGEDWVRFEADVMAKLRLTAPNQLLLRFDANASAASVQSAHWYPGLTVDGLKWISANFDSGPTRARLVPVRPADHGQCSLSVFEADGRAWHAAIYTRPDGRGFVAADLAEIRTELTQGVQQALTVVVPTALLFIAMGAWLLSVLTMRPVSRLRDAMKGLTPNALGQRLPAQGEDREFKELIEAYNTMLARLERSFLQASRFSADAAHELKTPLTILQGRLEHAVNQSENRAVQAELTMLQDEVGRLVTITRKLLLLSQADAGELTLQIARIDVTAMLNDLALDAQMLLTDQSFSGTIAPHLQTQGDAVLLTQLFNNLISNAVHYCRPGGFIDVEGRASLGVIEVIIRNASAVISPESRGRFFDRFYRGDMAHNREVDGHGLGLSLAREIARAHGGDLILEPSALDVVSLRFFLPVKVE